MDHLLDRDLYIEEPEITDRDDHGVTLELEYPSDYEVSCQSSMHSPLAQQILHDSVVKNLRKTNFKIESDQQLSAKHKNEINEAQNFPASENRIVDSTDEFVDHKTLGESEHKISTSSMSYKSADNNSHSKLFAADDADGSKRSKKKSGNGLKQNRLNIGRRNPAYRDAKRKQTGERKEWWLNRETSALLFLQSLFLVLFTLFIKWVEFTVAYSESLDL